MTIQKVYTLQHRKSKTINVKKDLIFGKSKSDAGVTVDGEQIEVVEHVKYLVSLKSVDDNCKNDIRSRIGMTENQQRDENGVVAASTTEHLDSQHASFYWK